MTRIKYLHHGGSLHKVVIGSVFYNRDNNVGVCNRTTAITPTQLHQNCLKNPKKSDNIVKIKIKPPNETKNRFKLFNFWHFYSS